MIFDDRALALGKGPLWHPEREQLFWFDIASGALLSRDATGPLAWELGEMASAAAWVDRDTLLVATETRLLTLDLATGARRDIAPLEPDNPVTRSNDGRADPFGGFWIGTMGKAAQPGAGAFYRYHRGELRRLYDGITIPNSLCFDPQGGFALFADTLTQVIQKVALDAEGWPRGDPAPWLDLDPDDLLPDGAVIDDRGLVWCAHYGAGRVDAYGPDARRCHSLTLPASQVTCPAFGGPDLATLFVTSAWQHLPEDRRAPDHGRTFALEGVARGLPEYRVAL